MTTQLVAPKRHRWLRRVLIGFGLAIAFWLLSSYAVGYRLTRRLHALHPEPAPPISWGTIQAFRLSTTDGEDIGAWYVDGKTPEPLVLLLHGHGGTRTHCLPCGELAASCGCSVMMITLRAHGDSSGDFDDIGYSARHDVVAAADWIEKNHPNRPIVIWGQSMGAAAAVFAAQELGEQGKKVRGYILECPYQDLHTAVRNRTEYFLPIGLDRLAYLGLLAVSPLVMPDGNKISPLNSISTIPSSASVLILAGGSDRRARPEEARALYERVQDHGQLVIFEGADHLQLMRGDPTYRGVVREFLRTLHVNH